MTWPERMGHQVEVNTPLPQGTRVYWESGVGGSGAWREKRGAVEWAESPGLALRRVCVRPDGELVSEDVYFYQLRLLEKVVPNSWIWVPNEGVVGENPGWRKQPWPPDL